MKSTIILVTTFLLTLIAGVSVSDDLEPAAARFNIDGKSYMGFMSVNIGGNPDPAGQYLFPIFMIFGQQGDNIFGTTVVPDLNIGLGAPELTGFKFETLSLRNSVVKGKRFKIDMFDSETKTLHETVTISVRNNGNIKSIVPVAGGKKITVVLQPCIGANRRMSGQYLGNAWIEGFSAPSSIKNATMGVFIQGASMTFAYILFEPSLSTETFFGSGVAVFDPATNTFSYQEETSDGTVTATGSIVNGKLDISLTIPVGAPGSARPPLNVNAAATLYHFGDSKQVKPRLKSVAPNTVSAGANQTVKIKHKNASPGSLIRIRKHTGNKGSDPDPLYIKGYYWSEKEFEVELSVASGVSGKVFFKVDNPNGRKSKGKTPLVVQ